LKKEKATNNLHRENRQPPHDKKHGQCAIYKQWTAMYKIMMTI